MSISGFFIRGVSYKLPNPSINPRLFLIAHAAIAKGIDLLRDDPPTGFNLSTANEDVITEKLQWVLENRLRHSKEVPGFNCHTFGRVWREPKVQNFNNAHPDKMPDLVLDLQRDSLPILSTHDGLFIECKPVDKLHPAGQDYCDKGLIRFVNGDYAWAMQEGMMVAFVRHNRSIAANLSSALAARNKPLDILSAPIPLATCLATPGAEPLRVSTHGRAFVWLDNHGRACDIKMYHSWHLCS